MKYFKDDGSKILCDKTKILGSGNGGCVYKTNDDKTIKVWYDIEFIDIDAELIKKIGSLKLGNYYRILSLLYKRKKDMVNEKDAIGYLYEYVKKDNIDILTMPVDYTIDNINELYKSVLILTKNKILADDLKHPGNVIMNKDGIIAIDVDYYTKDHYLSSKELRYNNIRELEQLFITLYLEAISKYHKNINNRIPNLSLKLNELFELRYKEEVKSVNKKLSKYKYPIEYFR